MSSARLWHVGNPDWSVFMQGALKGKCVGAGSVNGLDAVGGNRI